MNKAKLIGAAVGLALAASAGQALAAEKTVAGAACSNPPRIDFPQSNPVAALVGADGMATEPKTGRKFFLDFPCDLKPNEKVVFILSLHGAGSIGNWQRHYFPAIDYKEKYRLVIATPTAAIAQPTRRWDAAADDQYLQNISDLVIKEFGAKNIKSFWLAGHSQGGITSRRIVCSDYFKDKVDGFFSLSGGRINPPGAPAGTINGPTPPAAAPATPPAPQPLPTCDFSFIYDTGQLEILNGMASTSPWAEKYGCGARLTPRSIVDDKAGYVTATDQTRGPSWGRFARPGTSLLMVYPNCKDGRVVADIIRQDKGHTEGLEPHITEEILKLMVSAKGGKLQRS